MDQHTHLELHPGDLDDDYERAAEWLDAMADGPLDELSQRRFAQWLNANPQRRQILERMLSTWEDAALSAAAERYMKDLRQLAKPQVPSFGIALSWQWALAMCALVVVGFLGVQPYMQSNPSVESALATETARSKTWQLVDGSNVELSAKTRVAIRFSAHKRDLELQQGAAYFQVAKDKSRPFDVRIGDVSVVAVGTEFNIDKTQDTLEVTVHEGVVALRTSAAGEPQKLVAGQRALISKGKVSIASLDLKQLVDWRSGWIDIHNESLGYLVEHLNRYAATPIRLASVDVENLRVAGRFQLNKPDETLAMLAALYNLEIRRRASEQEVTYKTRAP